MDYVTTKERPAERKITLQVGIIGTSSAADGVIGRELQGILRSQTSSAVVETYARKGGGTYWMKKNFRERILAGRPNTVVIQGGVVNDIASGKPLSETQGNIDWMIAEAKRTGLRVVLMTVTPWEGYETWSKRKQQTTDEYNRWLLAKREEGVVVVDLAVLAQGGKLKPEFDSGDHLHPNQAGKEEVARQVAQVGFGIVDTRTRQVAPAGTKVKPATQREPERTKQIRL